MQLTIGCLKHFSLTRGEGQNNLRLGLHRGLEFFIEKCQMVDDYYNFSLEKAIAVVMWWCLVSVIFLLMLHNNEIVVEV